MYSYEQNFGRDDGSDFSLTSLHLRGGYADIAYVDEVLYPEDPSRLNVIDHPTSWNLISNPVVIYGFRDGVQVARLVPELDYDFDEEISFGNAF